MQFVTTLTQKGQATIPVHIRKKLDIKAGQKVAFEERGGEVIIKAAPDFLDLIGSLKTNKKYDSKKAEIAVGQYLAKQHSQKLKRE